MSIRFEDKLSAEADQLKSKLKHLTGHGKRLQRGDSKRLDDETTCRCLEYYHADEWAEGIECYRKTPLLTGK